MFTKLCLALILLALLTPVTMAGYYKLDPVKVDAGESIERELVLTPAINDCSSEKVDLSLSDDLSGIVSLGDARFNCNELIRVTVLFKGAKDFDGVSYIYANHYCEGEEGQSVEVNEKIPVEIESRMIVGDSKPNTGSSGGGSSAGGGGGGGLPSSYFEDTPTTVTPTETTTTRESATVTETPTPSKTVEPNTPTPNPTTTNVVKESPSFTLPLVFISLIVSLFLWRCGKK